MSGELLPGSPRQKSRLDEYLEERFPVLSVLGVPFNAFSGFVRPYVRIRTAEGAGVYASGTGLSSQCRDEYADEEDSLIRWATKPKDYGTEHEGFVEAVTTFRETGRAMLHLLHHVTDIQLSSAVCLDDIEELAIFPDNAARVKAMHQNAEVDGSSHFYNRLKQYSVGFSEEELAGIINNFWPEPEVIWRRED